MRETDEYARQIFEAHETPPFDTVYGVWRGRITHGYAVYTPLARNHDKLCISGWIPSGDWWLHCGLCRPERDSR